MSHTRIRRETQKGQIDARGWRNVPLGARDIVYNILAKSLISFYRQSHRPAGEKGSPYVLASMRSI